MYQNIALITAFAFLYSLTCGRLERTPISGPIIFTTFGLIFGPLGLGLLVLDVGTEFLRTLAELTLAIILFTDASNANLGVLKKSFQLPMCLLLVGLPLTILLGLGLGVLIFDSLSLIEIAILATMLAPTDAALGKAVVTDKSVPANIREGLNLESGLNDGICVPVLFVFLALATEAGGEIGTSILAIKLVAKEIGIGIAVGGGLTVLAVWLVKIFIGRGWVTETWRQLPVISLATTCFALAQSLGGSGFIACFIGGLLFGWLEDRHKHTLLIAAEGTGDTLTLITWVVFGSAVVGQTVGQFSWQIVLYSLFSLTLIRMLPVLLALVGTRLRTDIKLYLGWFGPRGLASIVFAVIVLNEQLPGGKTMALTVVCTVLLSIVCHGLSEKSFVNAFKPPRSYQ